MKKTELAILGVLLFGILGVPLASTGAKQPKTSISQDACPTGEEKARSVMEAFLTDSSWADERKEVGAMGLTAGDIRRLRDPEDTGMCEKLWEKSPSSNSEEIARVYYQADPYFFIVRVPREKSTPEDLNLYGESIEIFKTDSLEPVKVFLR